MTKSEQIISTLKEETTRQGVIVGVSVALIIVFVVMPYVVNPLIEYFDTDFIMDHPELVAKADAGYSQVCMDNGLGHTCIMKKEFNEFSMQGSYFHFDRIGGNGCQYIVENGAVVFDGVEANNGHCGMGGHGTNSAYTTLIEIDDYYITDRVDRNPNFYDEYIQSR